MARKFYGIFAGRVVASKKTAQVVEYGSVKLQERLYSGLAEILGGSTDMTPNRRRVVWYICAMSTAMYLVACASAIYWWIETRYSMTLPNMDYIAAGIGLTVLILSDLRLEHSFFGAKGVELSDEEVGKTTILAFLYAFFSFPVFMGTAIRLFAPEN